MLPMQAAIYLALYTVFTWASRGSSRWAAAGLTRFDEARGGIAFLSIFGGEWTTARSIVGGDLRCG
jgi:hypothetical protein